MGDSVSKYYELVSEEEFDKTVKKLKKKTVDGIGVIELFETEYPELADEFKSIQSEMYEMFARKHLDYGLNNIALGGDLTDKISRLKNLLSNGKNYVKGESMEDTFIDIANYGIIGLLVGRDKWKK